MYIWISEYRFYTIESIRKICRRKNRTYPTESNSKWHKSIITVQLTNGFMSQIFVITIPESSISKFRWYRTRPDFFIAFIRILDRRTFSNLIYRKKLILLARL